MNSSGGPRQSTRRFFFEGICLALIPSVLILSGCAAPENPAARGKAGAPSPATAVTPPVAARSSISTNTVTLPRDGLSLFDGKTLTGWAVTDFAGHGEVRVEDGKIILGMGYMTGVTWTNPVPRMNYEIELEAMRAEGSDFFCGLTFPVGDDPCSLIVGGWGGGVVGLSSLDGEDAAHNETTRYMNFEKDHWYHIRLRVTPKAIEAWIGEEKIAEVSTTGRSISIRSEVELSRPLGVATYSTTGVLRHLRIRPL
jgi:hypothetical protein